MTRCIKFFLMLFAFFLIIGFYAFADSSQADFSQIDFDSIEEVFFLAERLDRMSLQKEAATEYKRYLFLLNYQDGSYASESCKKLYEYYLPVDMIIAMHYLRRAETEVVNSADYETLLLLELDLICKMNCANLKITDSSTELQKRVLNLNAVRQSALLFNDAFSDRVKSAAWIYLLIEDLTKDDFEKFNSDFELAVSFGYIDFTAAQIQQIRNCYDALTKFKPKKKLLAAYLSILPGLGQLYAGDVKDSVNSFIINGSLIGWGVYAFFSKNFFDYIFILNPLERFYRGNLYNAQKDVYEYNDEKYKKLKQPIYEILKETLPKKLSQ